MAAIWIASYPKSGNTWMRILLANLLAGGDRPQSINAMGQDHGMAGERLLFEEMTLTESRLLTEAETLRLRPMVYDALDGRVHGRRLIKIHDAFWLPDGAPVLTNKDCRVLYLSRDPRDVAVSFAHHLDCTVEQAVALMADRACTIGGTSESNQFRQTLGRWGDHLRHWLDQTIVPVHAVRYEDLRSDTEEIFARALAFLGVAAADEDIRRAIRHSDLAELQRQERQDDFFGRVGTSPFFRQGLVGGWRQVLSRDLVRAIEAAHGPMMDRLGYVREETA